MNHTDTRLGLRAAVPADLPQLEAWCHAVRPDEAPPYVAVTLAEFAEAPKRGFLLIVQDGDRDVGFVVLSRLWSNRGRGDAVVLDDRALTAPIDADLLRHELRRHVATHGIIDIIERGADGTLTVLPSP